MKTIDKSLEEQLNSFKKEWSANVTQEVTTTFQNGIDSLVEKNIVSGAIKKGDYAPNFYLQNHLGEMVTLMEILKKNRVILTWYRGGWCPYCNLTLRALQNLLPEFEAQNAQLIALTPEIPDHSLTTKEKNELTFTVLTDVNNEVAKEYNLVFKVSPEVNTFYKKFHDLIEFNGGSGDELPLTATYIIEQNGEISYSFIDVDYRKRAEPSEILKHLNGFK